jgi:hypothetical protein
LISATLMPLSLLSYDCAMIYISYPVGTVLKCIERLRFGERRRSSPLLSDILKVGESSGRGQVGDACRMCTRPSQRGPHHQEPRKKKVGERYQPMNSKTLCAMWNTPFTCLANQLTPASTKHLNLIKTVSKGSQRARCCA